MLEIKNLICGYDSKFVLQDINLKVENKELIGIIGPNGSGKTTLLRAVTRVLKPRKGVILFEKKDIWQMTFKELAKRIAVVPQSFVGAGMSVEEFVLLGRIPHLKKFQFLETKKDMETAKRCMTLTDTLNHKAQLMEEISGGEKQLALIARALAQEPTLLLLDEPTTHLDITHQIGILDLTKRLNREFGLTVVMVLHDLNMAARFSDKLLLLKEGKVYNTGYVQNVLTCENIEKVFQVKVKITHDSETNILNIIPL